MFRGFFKKIMGAEDEREEANRNDRREVAN